ncbi:hypothetical protein BBJ28_00025494 [Nothophytophthora sp. Chile5]|nr:hypothetical protein BBJ28_00025494 [Nothophytophthora sp. Chile5]
MAAFRSLNFNDRDSSDSNASPDLTAGSHPSQWRTTRGQDRARTTSRSGSSRRDRSASSRRDHDHDNDREEPEREEADRAADMAAQEAIVRGQQERRGKMGATGKALGVLCTFPGCTARVMYTQSFAVHFRAAHSDGEYDVGDRKQYERAIDDPRVLEDPRVLQHRLANQEAARVLQDAAMANIAARVDSVGMRVDSVAARVDSFVSDLDARFDRHLKSVVSHLKSMRKSIRDTQRDDLNVMYNDITSHLDKNFESLAQGLFSAKERFEARFDGLERSLRATKRSSSSDAPSRRSPAKVARGLSSQTVYDVDADTEEKEPASQDDDDDEDAQGDEAPKSMFPPAQAAEALPASPTPSATSTLPLPPTPAQAPPAPSSSTPASLPPKASTPKAKPPTPKMKKDQKRERAKLKTEIQTKAQEMPKIWEKFTVVEMSWEDRTKSLATAEAKLAADPSDAAASESVANFNQMVKSLKKDKDALEAELTLYELLEATAGAPKFLTDVNRRATSEKAKRATFNNKVKSAAGILTARKNDFTNAVDEEAKKAAHKKLEMATAAHKKASDDAAKQSNVATAVLAQKFQTKVSVDRMIELASTVLNRLDAESIDADFVGVCADAKRDFVAFRKQVESFDAESVTL